MRYKNQNKIEIASPGLAMTRIIIFGARKTFGILENLQERGRRGRLPPTENKWQDRGDPCPTSLTAPTRFPRGLWRRLSTSLLDPTPDPIQESLAQKLHHPKVQLPG